MSKLTPPWLVGTTPLEKASEALAKLSGRMVHEGYLTAVTATAQANRIVVFSVYVVPAVTHITYILPNAGRKTESVYEPITEAEVRTIIEVQEQHDPGASTKPDDPVLCPVYGTNPYKHGIDVTPESDPDRTKHQLATLADEIRLAGIRCGAICDWAVPNGPELIATIRGMADRINELQQKQRAED